MELFFIVERAWGRNNSVDFDFKNVIMIAKSRKTLFLEYFTLFSPEKPLNNMGKTKMFGFDILLSEKSVFLKEFRNFFSASGIRMFQIFKKNFFFFRFNENRKKFLSEIQKNYSFFFKSLFSLKNQKNSLTKFE